MKNYTAQVWFRYGDNEKDSEIYTVKAKDRIHAEVLLREKRRFTFAVDFKETSGMERIAKLTTKARLNFIENTLKNGWKMHQLNEKSNYSVRGFFNWESTPQGHKYWQEIL